LIPSSPRSAALRPEIAFSLIWGVSIRIIGVGLAAYVLYRVRFILITVLISAVLALILSPVVDALCRYRLPGLNYRSKRFAVTLVLFLLLIVGAGYANYFLLTPFRVELRRLLETIDLKQGAVHAYAQSFNAWYHGLPPDMQDFLAGQAGLIGPKVAEGLRLMFRSTLQWVAHIVDLVTIPVLAFYFVLDSRPLKREVLFMVPRRRIREALVIMREAGIILQAYAIAQIILCIIAGLVVGAGLQALGVKYSLTLGILAGITRAIPILGPIIGGIPIVLIALLQSVKVGGGVLIFFTLLHLIESKILMPKLLGDRLHLHPALILISLLVGAEFFGVLGMFLAVPVAALFKVLFDFYVLRPKKRPRRSYARIEMPEQIPG
jgi:predicted PurR-regulated permease PerM